MSELPAIVHRGPRRPLPAAGLPVLVGASPVLPAVRAARAVQRRSSPGSWCTCCCWSAPCTRDRTPTSEFLDWSGQPVVLALNVVALAFVLLHAVTWFNLAPQAIVVRMRGRRVPAASRSRQRTSPPGRWCRRSWRWILVGGAVMARRSSDGGRGVAAVQRRRNGLGAAGSGAAAALRRGLPAGPARAARHADLLAVLATRSSGRPARAVRALPAALGAPIPLHPLRRPTAQAAADTDQPCVLRRSRGRVGMGSDRLTRLTRNFTALARPPHRTSLDIRATTRIRRGDTGDPRPSSPNSATRSSPTPSGRSLTTSGIDPAPPCADLRVPSSFARRHAIRARSQTARTRSQSYSRFESERLAREERARPPTDLSPHHTAISSHVLAVGAETKPTCTRRTSPPPRHGSRQERTGQDHVKPKPNSSKRPRPLCKALQLRPTDRPSPVRRLLDVWRTRAAGPHRRTRQLSRRRTAYKAVAPPTPWPLPATSVAV